jgi:hypothetical protein
MKSIPLVVAIVTFFTFAGDASAKTPEEWVALGTRVHGGFGSLLALGIRIGEDAMQRLSAGPRDLEIICQD